MAIEASLYRPRLHFYAPKRRQHLRRGPSGRARSRPAGDRVALVTVVLSFSAAGLVGCDNDCDFFQRCNGSVREVCGDGPDQTFHRRIRRYPCDEPNTVCIERDADHAACFLPDETICGDTFERRCEGETLIVCSSELGYTDPSNEPPRYLEGVDCEADGRSCVDYGSDASCVESR